MNFLEATNKPYTRKREGMREREREREEKEGSEEDKLDAANHPLRAN